MSKVTHKSVLANETIDLLNIKKDETYVDTTLGGAGHTKKILELGGKVLGIDADPEAVLEVSRQFSIPLKKVDGKLIGKGPNLILVQGNFSDLETIAKKAGVWVTPGVIFDLGFSSIQLDGGVKGLSFQKDEDLDMRMDPSLEVTAADLINGLNQGELNELFSKYGQEPASRLYARAIVQARVETKIKTSGKLADLISRSAGRRGRTHPATRVFLALRIAVNDELRNLQKGLTQAAKLLKQKGRILVISFNSLEDSIVKNFFKEQEDLKIVTKKPLVPSREEILNNPRSRSAKLRAAEKNQ